MVLDTQLGVLRSVCTASPVGMRVVAHSNLVSGLCHRLSGALAPWFRRKKKILDLDTAISSVPKIIAIKNASASAMAVYECIQY